MKQLRGTIAPKMCTALAARGNPVGGGDFPLKMFDFLLENV